MRPATRPLAHDARAARGICHTRPLCARLDPQSFAVPAHNNRRSSNSSFLGQSISFQPRPLAVRSRGPLLVRVLRQSDPKRQKKYVKAGGNEPETVANRLSKVLAAAGVASRRAAEQLIFAGKVKVNGVVVTTPQTVADPTKDKVEVAGKHITAQPQKKFYFAVNKPKGYACTSSAPDNEGGSGKLVIELLRPWLDEWRRRHPRGTLPPRLFTVGRLDVQSVGLLFVTNDGQWAQKVMHPSSGLTREYIATVDRPATRRHLQQVAEGTEVEGVHVTPVAVAIDGSNPADGNCRVRMVVSEGRKHEVRELFGSVGLNVKFLKRVRVGGYRMPKGLGLGEMVVLQTKDLRRTLDRGADAGTSVSG